MTSRPDLLKDLQKRLLLPPTERGYTPEQYQSSKNTLAAP